MARIEEGKLGGRVDWFVLLCCGNLIRYLAHFCICIGVDHRITHNSDGGGVFIHGVRLIALAEAAAHSKQLLDGIDSTILRYIALGISNEAVHHHLVPHAFTELLFLAGVAVFLISREYVPNLMAVYIATSLVAQHEHHRAVAALGFVFIGALEGEAEYIILHTCCINGHQHE